jgi:hypothetical protein
MPRQLILQIHYFNSTFYLDWLWEIPLESSKLYNKKSEFGIRSDQALPRSYIRLELTLSYKSLNPQQCISQFSRNVEEATSTPEI